jgi:lysozyme
MTTQADKNRKRAIALSIAAAIAIPAEGLRQYAYYDPPGILTVCYGTTTDVIKGKKYTMEECKASLERDMLSSIDIVDKCKGDGKELPVKTWAALADAVYNIGPKIVCNPNSSTLARKLQAGDLIGACNELPKWDKASVGGKMIALPGLTKRRAAEKEICLQGVAEG